MPDKTESVSLSERFYTQREEPSDAFSKKRAPKQCVPVIDAPKLFVVKLTSPRKCTEKALERLA
jgi:hypothetical protein